MRAFLSKCFSDPLGNPSSLRLMMLLGMLGWLLAVVVWARHAWAEWIYPPDYVWAGPGVMLAPKVVQRWVEKAPTRESAA